MALSEKKRWAECRKKAIQEQLIERARKRGIDEEFGKAEAKAFRDQANTYSWSYDYNYLIQTVNELDEWIAEYRKTRNG